MEQDTMGRVLTEATIENLEDFVLAERNVIPPDQVRRVTVTDALVDTGLVIPALPRNLIQQLGLSRRSARWMASSTGSGETSVYGTVRLTIQGRDCPTDVTELPDNVPVRIGRIPLTYLDFVVDSSNQKLIGNPAHGGEHVFELY